MRRKLIYSISFVLLFGLLETSTAKGADPNLVGWWKFEEASGTLYDQSDYHNDGTPFNGVLYQQPGREGYSLGFDGIDDLVVVGSTARPTNTFSFGGWIKTSATHEIDPEVNSGYGGVNNQKYVFEPQHGGDLNAGAGLSVGTNGIAVYEHGSDYMPATAVYSAAIGSGWNHIMVVYSNRRPTIYLNGQAVRTGLSGPRATVYAPIQLGGMAYGYFAGLMDEMRIYNKALSAAEVQELSYWPEAHNPVPADGSTGVTSPLLQWTVGDGAALHDIYFGTNPTPGPAEFILRQTWNMYWHGAGITPGTTYYWRIDEVEADGLTIHTGDVWSFTAAPLTAYSPNPADGAKWVDTEADLVWFAGATGIKHDVYFGTDQAAVANGTGGTLKSSQQTTRTYDPGTLAMDTTYYWRIDEYDSGGIKYPGTVWSFTTISANAGIRGYYFNNMNLSGAAALVRVDSTINFNWGTGTPGAPITVDTFSVRWAGVVEALYSEPYVFTCNTDDGFRMWLNDVLIIDSWIDQGATMHPSSAVNLVAGQQYGVRVEYYENGGSAVAQLYWQSSSTPRQMIPAGALQLPLMARNPSPSNGAVDVKHTPTLRWTAGEKAAKHNVFFGTDATTVANATAASAGIYRGQQDLAANSYVPSEAPLAWNSTYYWRIDEVNAADAWKGNVWSFTTANFIVVDDFEDYTDDVGSRIFQTWKDGWGYSEPSPGYPGNGTGSTVGYAQAPFAEPTTVHGGNQSMPLGYDNTGASGKARYSETVREWTSPQDWTVNNVKALTLYFYGAPANAAEQLYVAVEDNAGHVKVVNHPDLEAAQIGAWQEWNIELTQFSGAGVNLKAIKKMYIGLGNRTSPKAGGTGTIFIDDIRVYPSRCVPSVGKPAADLSGNCIVDLADVEILANLWLDSGFQITPVNPGTAGLVAQYPFNGNANDSVGGHNGTVNGNPQWVTGYLEGALKFGGSGDYVEIGYSPDLSLNEFTLSAWVKIAADPGIFGILGTRAGGEYTFDLKVMAAYIHGDIGNGTAWINTAIDIGSGDTGTTGTGGDLVVYRWHMIAYVIDNTHQQVRLYLDGDLKRTISISGTPLLMQSGESMRIGDTGYSEWMNGLIDEVRIYNRALSAAEIAWLAGYTSLVSIPADLQRDNVINFKDFAKLADSWLEEILWP